MDVISPVRIITTYQKKKIKNVLEFNDSIENIAKKTCLGILVSYCNKYYVITCYHGIQNNTHIEMVNEFGKYNMKELYTIKQYDFAVLNFNEKYDINNNKKIDLITNITDINNPKLKINYLDAQSTDYYKKINLEQIDCELQNIITSKFKSEMFPAILALEIQINDISSDMYEGLSGSIISDNNNKILGMISYYNIENKTFIAIPSYCIKLFFIMALSKDRIRSYCLNTEAKENYNIIKKHYNINYKTDTGENIKFKLEDKIKSINDTKFDDEGNIYLEELGASIPLDIYFILKNSKYHTFVFIDKKNNIIEKNICTIPLEDYTMFNIESKDIVEYKGLIITEASEELLLYYYKSGINIKGKLNDYYNDCYSNKQKIIIILNIKYEGLDENLSKMYKHNGLPLIKNRDEVYIPIISKINNNKINNLDELNKIISASNVCSIRLDISKKKSIVLNYTNLI